MCLFPALTGGSLPLRYLGSPFSHLVYNIMYGNVSENIFHSINDMARIAKSYF